MAEMISATRFGSSQSTDLEEPIKDKLTSLANAISLEIISLLGIVPPYDNLEISRTPATLLTSDNGRYVEGGCLHTIEESLVICRHDLSVIRGGSEHSTRN
jgi:hypothetical protein